MTESAELTDAVTGQKREVDILIEDKAGWRPVRIAVAVTEQARKVDQPWVETQLRRTDDLRPHIHHLVLVSKAGFYYPARLKAEDAGAEALTFEEALEEDWTRIVGQVSDLALGRHDLIVHSISPQLLIPEGQYATGPIDAAAAGIFAQDGTRVGSFQEWFIGSAFQLLYDRAAAENWTSGYQVGLVVRPRRNLWLEDATGTRWRLQAAYAHLEYRLDTAIVPMVPALYGSSAVAHGAAEAEFGEVSITIVERPETDRVRASIDVHDPTGRRESRAVDLNPPGPGRSREEMV